MSLAAPSASSPVAPKAAEPPLWSLALIFWAAFAAAIVAGRVMNPEMFERWDPDNLMRLVQVRDLLAGQGWFDLVQRRLDPPDGLLMHWSRLIDAPLALLVIVGNLFGAGEAFALTAWPLMLFLGFMAASMASATALGGRRAAVPALVLSLFCVGPMLMYLPNNIDHHNAQLALAAAMLAATLRLGAQPRFGLAAGFGAALMLAVGLEMLPYVAVLAVVVALSWAARGERADGTACFAVAFGLASALLYLAAGSPAARFACDTLSWSYALPIAVAGFGLAALTRIAQGRGVGARLGGLAALAIVSGGAFALIAPDCLGGPFAHLSPELKAVWLANITEARPVYVFTAIEPVGMIATLGPPVVALAVALRRAWAGGAEAAALWALPAALIAAALAMSFYQVRTLPFANAMAIPVLAAFIAEALADRARIASGWARAASVAAAVLVATPLFHLSVGWAAIGALSLATDGRRAPPPKPEAPSAATAGLTKAEKECVDAGSAALLAKVPDGVLLAPVFYGSGLLAVSRHAVVAAPYHRAGPAILDAIRAVGGSPEAAHAIASAHAADYLALCGTARESAVNIERSPEGLLARLLAGESFAWLEPVPADAKTQLRLWRVKD